MSKLIKQFPKLYGKTSTGKIKNSQKILPKSPIVSGYLKIICKQLDFHQLVPKVPRCLKTHMKTNSLCTSWFP